MWTEANPLEAETPMKTLRATSLLLLGLTTACGYYGDLKRSVFGGISSTGDKPEDGDPEKSGDATPQTEAPPESAPMPGDIPAGFQCDASPKLTGARFALGAAAAAPEGCKGLACATAFDFTSRDAVQIGFAAQKPVTGKYDQCGLVVRIRLDGEVRTLTVSDDGAALNDGAAKQTFERQTP